MTVAQPEKLATCERFLKELQFRDFRLRDQGESVCIEISPRELSRLLERATRDIVVQKFKAAGFRYVSLDLEGNHFKNVAETGGNEDG